MSDTALHSRSALHGIASPGRFGHAGGAPGLIIEERTDLALASVIARPGKAEAVAAAVLAYNDVTLPPARRRSAKGSVAFAAIGPGQWMASAEGPLAGDFVVPLARHLAGLASVSDQSDGRLVLRVGGPKVRETLAKGVPIDLHPRGFKAGDVANTVVAYMGLQIAQLDDAPTYELMVFRSMAVSFWSWLTASAAEFGFELKTPAEAR